MKLRTCTELDAESIRLVLDSNAFLNATSKLLLLPLKMFANVRLSLILTVTCVYCMHRSLSPRQNLSATMPHGLILLEKKKEKQKRSMAKADTA